MPALKVLRFSPEELTLLRERFHQLEDVTPFAKEPKLCSLIASYGMVREIGTINDELARFIFNSDSGEPVPLASLHGELIEWRGMSGVRITSSRSQRLELRTKGFYDVVHPSLSRNTDWTLHSLHIFPEIIAHITAQEGVDLVTVKSWGENSIFGSFDPEKSYYQTNLWEIENNDVLKFSDLVRKGQVAFLGTHDLIAHIAGIQKKDWTSLRSVADRVFQAVESYFHSIVHPSIAASILPYTIGVVLDDLAQPPSYGSKSHLAVLDELLRELAAKSINPDQTTLLTSFPKSFQSIIDLSRTNGIESNNDIIKTTVGQMIREIRSASLTTWASLNS